MSKKNFTRCIEDFVCAHCDTRVEGNGYTNHCPHCLWSKHVDCMPGDRAETCQGLLEPVAARKKHGNYVLIHRCQRCKEERCNKVGPQDNFEILLTLELRN